MTAVRFAGDVTIQNAAEMRETLTGALAGNVDVELDLSAVTELDTAGLQLLLFAAAEAARTGGGLRLVSPSEPVRDVLALVGLDQELRSVSIATGSGSGAM